MAFKVFITFVWIIQTAFVVSCLITVAQSQLDMISKIVLYVFGTFVETFVSCLFIEGLGS